MNEPKNNLDYIQIRSILAGNVDNILEAIANFKNATKAADSHDLFDFGENASTKTQAIPWNKNVPKLQNLEVLLQEKNSLGLYVSGAPMDGFAEVQKWAREIVDNEDLFLILIDKIKKIFTRSNTMMFAIQLSTPDNDRQYEGIVFPKYAPVLSPHLREKEIFWVRGRVNEDRRAAKRKENNEGDSENEYQELPKIVFENVTDFVNGPAILYNNDEVQLPKNRVKELNQVDWQAVLANPKKFEKILYQNLNKQNKTKDEIVQIQIPSTVSKPQLKLIKSLLSTQPTNGLSELTLWIEKKGEYKKVKGQYWADVSKINQIIYGS